jgi:cytochrome c biogenesis protein CcmG/thiol:disulfide interchange protein DsbE
VTRLAAPRWRIALVVAAGALLLAGCSQNGNEVTGTPLPVGSSTVDTGAGEGAPAPPSAAAIAKAGLASCPAASAVSVSNGLPDVTLPCLGAGPAVHLSALRGTPMVVNIWASWCGPCREELPVLAKVSKAAGSSVQFLGVDVADFQPEGALSLLTQEGIHYPSVVDWDKKTQPTLRWPGPPMTVFVRADGTIAYKQIGPVQSENQLQSLISLYLGVSVPT